MHQLNTLFCLVLATLFLSACGGNDSSSPIVWPAASSTPPSSTAPSSVALSSAAPSSTAAMSSTETSASSSAEPARLTLDMANGWRGNGSGNSGVTYSGDGVVFAPTGDNVGAVTDLSSPIQLEDAIIEMVVSVSNEYKTSGASLQIFAQIKGGNWDGEWGCWSGNELLTTDTDVTLSCTIEEADGKFDQTEHDVQLGIQAKGTPAGTVTIKQVTLTLAQAASSSSSTGSVYSANVDSLRELADFPIGVAVSNTDSPSFNILSNTAEQTVVEQHFNQMTAGNIMKMSYLQPTQGNFTFTDADAFVDYALSNNFTVHGHSLVWHSGYQVPEFMSDWSGSAADFIAVLEEHVTTIVDHYKTKGGVVSWDVVNEALDDNSPSNFRTDSAFYTHSDDSAVYIEKAFLAARAADPDVDLYYNDYNIDQNNAKTTKLVEMITDFQTRDIPLDGIGFQMHVFMDYPSIATISAALQKVVDKGLKVKITELDVAVNNPHSNDWPANKTTQFSETIALAQQQRYCEIIQAYLTIVPAAQRGGISVWGTTDTNTWLHDLYKTQYNNEKIAWPLLFDNNYNDKPALRGFADGLEGVACN